MRYPLTTSLGILLVAATLSFRVAGQDEVVRPNVLLIVADDLSFGDLGAAGAITRTPNIDSLAERGLMFTRFHASPVCSVTRSMLMTGNNPVEVGLGAFDYALYPPAEGKPGYEAYLTRTTATVAELLQDAGYQTYQVGKWHLGGAGHGGEGPEQWGFDRTYGIYTGGSNHWNQGVFHVDMSDPKVVAEIQAGIIPTEPFYENGQQVTRPTGVFSDDLYTSKMMEFIEQGRESGEPFFAYLAYTTPHAPIQAPDFLIDQYYGYYLENGFDGLKRARFEAQKELGLIPPDAPFPDSSENPLLRNWADLSEEEQRVAARSMATYTAMIESQDYHIGTLLNYLRESGQLDNTLIIYLSDNGGEGLDVRGDLSNPAASQWIQSSFSSDFDDIGQGNYFAFIGTDFANSVSGGLSWWKWFIGEGGVRVPLIVVPPKNMPFAHADQKTSAFASVKDIPMTILDYAGVTHPGSSYKGRTVAEPSGLSMRNYLEGNQEQPRTEDDWHAFELFGNSYVVAGDYKAIRVRTGMYGDGEWHLYNILNDPGETTPLDQADPQRLQQMIEIYEQYAIDMGIVPVAENWSPWHGFLDEEEEG